MSNGVGDHLFWITSRAAGTVTLLLASVAVAFGLLMSTPFARGRRPDLRVVHEALSLATLLALTVHAGSLLFDSFLNSSVLDVTVPFVSGYAEPWTGIGIVAGWALALLGLSAYWRTKIGVARWRRLHRWTALAWLAGLVHALGEGTDSGQTWFLVSAGIVVAPALALLVSRVAPRPAGVSARPTEGAL
jgi:sulfoxide reductase heme-binding subunit YedZ